MGLGGFRGFRVQGLGGLGFRVNPRYVFETREGSRNANPYSMISGAEVRGFLETSLWQEIASHFAEP